MTNKEINEFLAENLFGLEKMDENPSYFYTDKTKKWVLPSDDYILNYQPVLEELCEQKDIYFTFRKVIGKPPQCEITFKDNKFPSIVENGDNISKGNLYCSS